MKRDSRGAVLLELAIVVPLLAMFSLGILELALAARQSDKTGTITRGIARTAAAGARQAGFETVIVTAANSGVQDLPDAALSSSAGAEMWVYRAGTNGRPLNSSGAELSVSAAAELSEGECSDCDRYTWNGTTWVRVWPTGQGYTPSEQYTCGTGAHAIGVRMTTAYTPFTGSILPVVPQTFTKTSVFRLEPDPVGACSGAVT